MNRRLLTCIAALLLPISCPGAGEQASRTNVLFIAVDDLRPQMGCYGDRIAVTPHMDKLASQGLLLTRAYCQQAVCSPSRVSLLTGTRPDTNRVYDLTTHFRRTIPGVVTLPELFRKSGYHTEALGKIYHNGLDDPASWSGVSDFMASANPDEQRVRPVVSPAAQKKGRGPSWEAPDVEDDALPDGRIATAAIEALRRNGDRPFFLAVGFYKPHLPFVAPKKYYDLYPPETVPLADNPFHPEDVPKQALTGYGELRSYGDIPAKGPIPDDKARELVRGYYAAMSYADAQVGRVLEELDTLGLRDKTIVILWGDHGWQLGEHGLWSKHTNFEIATRSPVIISVPKQSHPGSKSAALVELVDVYPTLAELCGLSVPETAEGRSFAPLLDTPDMDWKKAAYSQYPRGRENGVMGYSVRTDRHRYTEWIDLRTSAPVATELYDHRTDPRENRNIATRVEDPSLTPSLSRLLREPWKSARRE